MPATELAFRIGRSEATVWRYETGVMQPSVATAQLIAEVLESDLNTLFPAQEAA